MMDADDIVLEALLDDVIDATIVCPMPWTKL